MSNNNDLNGELEALNAMMGGLPPGFDQQSPAYQRAFLQRRIPELQKQIADEEARIAAAAPSLQQRGQLQLTHSERMLQWQKDRYEASKKGIDFTTPKPVAPKGGGFFEALGDAFGGLFSHGQLDAKRKILMDMEARLDALQSVLPAPKSAIATPQQQRAQIQAEIAATMKEKTQSIANMAQLGLDPVQLQAIERAYDDKIQKLIDKL